MVSFPLFDGKDGYNEHNDFVLRFTTDDTIQLKKKYRPEGKDVFISVEARERLGAVTYKPILWLAVASADEEAVCDCLRLGLKMADGKRRALHSENLLKDLPFLAIEAAPFILDALSWAWNGKSASAVEAENAKVASAVMAGGEEAALDDPPMNSSGSTTPPLESDFPPTLSGD